jgi:predicted phosphodiesterase
MKIIIYSDLHLEFDHLWRLPADIEGDLLVLAGDIINFGDFNPLRTLLRDWKKPVLFVAGNHEYYTYRPMRNNEEEFRDWLAKKLPQVHFLRNEGAAINGVNFFGGTMWTDFKSGDAQSMRNARVAMYDYQYICGDEGMFTPQASIAQHQLFIAALEQWFEKRSSGPAVVITHHAPVVNPMTKFPSSPLQPAFVSYEMNRYIEKYSPTLWIYGHTHECDSQRLGKTRIISNQLGYPAPYGGYENTGIFDNYGYQVEV